MPSQCACLAALCLITAVYLPVWYSLFSLYMSAVRRDAATRETRGEFGASKWDQASEEAVPVYAVPQLEQEHLHRWLWAPWVLEGLTATEWTGLSEFEAGTGIRFWVKGHTFSVPASRASKFQHQLLLKNHGSSVLGPSCRDLGEMKWGF